MAELKELEIQLSDVGWEGDKTQALPVWGLVDFPQDLLKYILDYKKKTFVSYDSITGKKIKTSDKRAPVWTAFDKYLYHDYNPNSRETLPKISAIFKFCFNHKYSAIVENLGMQIALALDLPTSYNYLVAFTPEKHPETMVHFTDPTLKNKIQPIGIVSIDFLQARLSPMQKTGQVLYQNEDIDAFSAIDSDQLLSFHDAFNQSRIRLNALSGEENLLENWIEVVDTVARTRYKNLPREQLNKMIDGIHSRIARSSLLKEILGDSDFTSHNGGAVINQHKMRYAANFDYGNACNNLIKSLTFDKYSGMKPEVFSALPKNIQEKILEANQKFANKSVSELATEWASGTSEENFYYVLRNFPNASQEFFTNLDNVIKRGQIEKIIDKYTKTTIHGMPLLSKEEALTFKQYLCERATHFCQLYIDYLNNNHSSIPQSDEDSQDYSMTDY